MKKEQQLLRADRSFIKRELLILGLLYQHRMLCTNQLHRMIAGWSRDSSYIRQLLRPLRLRGLVASVYARQRGARKIWYLTPEGAHIAQNRQCGEDRPYPITAASAAGFLQRHTLAVNEVGLSFVKAADRQGHECGPFAWRHEISHRVRMQETQFVQSDALLHYLTTTAAFSFFIELDRASTPIEELVTKLRRYAALHNYKPTPTSLGWREYYHVFPHILVIFKEGQRASSQIGTERRMNIVQQIALADPQITSALQNGMHASFAQFDQLKEQGPLEPIFQPLSLNNDKNFINALGERPR